MSFRAFLHGAGVKVQRPSLQRYITLEQYFPNKDRVSSKLQVWSTVNHPQTYWCVFCIIERRTAGLWITNIVSTEKQHNPQRLCIIPDLTIKLGHLASDVLVIQMVAPEHPVHALHTGTMDFVEA